MSKPWAVLVSVFLALSACVVQAAEPVQSNLEDKPDPRLSQKVTYQAKGKPVKVVLAELSKVTGVTLKAGYNDNDWQVRDRRMNVFVKDLPLLTLMNSMSRVMRFVWFKNEKADPPTYRLYTDRHIISEMTAEYQRRQNELKAEVRARRSEYCDILAEVAAMSDAEAESLKDRSAYLYLEKKIGMPEAVTAVFREAPRIRELFIQADRNLNAPMSLLSTETKQLLIDTMRRRWYYERPDKSFPDLEPSELKTSMGWQVYPRLTVPSEFRQQLGLFGQFVVNVGPKAQAKSNLIRVARLGWPDCSFMNLRAKVLTKCGDNKIPEDQFWDTLESEKDYAAVQEDFVDDIAYYMLFEPRTEHADDPVLNRKFKLKLDDKKGAAAKDDGTIPFDDAAEALAKSAEVCVVTDSFKKTKTKVTPGEKEMREFIDAIADDAFCNWNRHGAIMEFSHRDWFKRRSTQIPDEWVEAWKTALTTKGYLSVEEMASIYALEYEQIAENINPDPTLGRFFPVDDPDGFIIVNNHPVSKLYLRLGRNERAQMFTEAGLNMVNLTPEQWQLARGIFEDGNRFSWDNDILLSSSPEDLAIIGLMYTKDDNATWCKFTTKRVDGTKQVMSEFKLPSIAVAAPVPQQGAK